MYYQSLKSEVKDELYQLNRNTISFINYTQEAIKINNRQYKQKQEKKAEKSGITPKFHPQANQSKKQEHIASSNNGRPGKMDLNSINYKGIKKHAYPKKPKGKFEGTCNYCGKIGHKEKDCYTKKNKEGRTTPKRPATPDKAQINTIRENTHANLS